MASAQCFQRLRSSSEMITLNYACISHNGLQALSPCSISLKPETTLPDGYDSSLFFFFFFFFFLLFRAALRAHGSSQARGQIRAVAAGLHHSSQQCWILSPLSKAGDRTCVLMDTSWVRYCLATMGTPYSWFSS